MMPNRHFEPIIDPRGKQKKYDLKLAPRPGIEGLKQGPILFYNNTKLSGGRYDRIFPQIKTHLSAQGIRRWIDVTETIRGNRTDGLMDLAERLIRLNAAAAILALGDMGVSPATTVLTIALEKRGLPAVYLTASPGHELAQAVAFYRAGRLCLCPLDIYQGSTAIAVEGAVDRQMERIMACLSAPADRLNKVARIDFPMDRIPPESNGLIDLSDRLDMRNHGPGEIAAGLDEVLDLFEEWRIGDGLPVAPPTAGRVDCMLNFWPADSDDVLFSDIGPSGGAVTIFHAAVSAVMAGCRPEHFPIVVTALRAMAEPSYNLIHAITTSHPGGNLVLVSGPLVHQIGLHGGPGCLGSGFRANATIGRAVNLVLINVCRAVPGIADLACLSSPAEFTYCFAEDDRLSPWKTINAERFNTDTTTVLVLKAEGPHAVMDFSSQTGEDLLETIVDCSTTLGSNNAYLPGSMVLVLTPDHARLLHGNGYEKNDIREHIHTHAGFPVSRLVRRGIVAAGPKGAAGEGLYPVTRSPRDVEVVVAGGRGSHSQVILPWALHSEAVVLPVRLPDGRTARHIHDFRRTSP